MMWVISQLKELCGNYQWQDFVCVCFFGCVRIGVEETTLDLDHQYKSIEL